MSIDSSGSSFLTNQNASIIGMPSEFSELNLPSYRDVIAKEKNRKNNTRIQNFLR